MKPFAYIAVIIFLILLATAPMVSADPRIERQILANQYRYEEARRQQKAEDTYRRRQAERRRRQAEINSWYK